MNGIVSVDFSKGCIAIATCVVLHRDSSKGLQALILKRGPHKKEGPNLWTVPGGHVDEQDLGDPAHGTSHLLWERVAERAACREVYEESGIVIPDFSASHLVSVGTMVYVRSDGMKSLVTRFVHFLNEKPPVIRLDRDATAYAWVQKGELEQYDFIGSLRREIHEIMEQYGG